MTYPQLDLAQASLHALIKTTTATLGSPLSRANLRPWPASLA